MNCPHCDQPMAENDSSSWMCSRCGILWTLTHNQPKQIAAVLSGCDWSDASVDHLLIPEGTDLESAQRDWRKWYKEEFMPGPRSRGSQKPKYRSLSDWLVEYHGAEYTSIIEIDTESGEVHIP